MQRVCNQNGPNRRSANNHEFGRLKENKKVAMLHEIAGKNGAKYNDDPNNYKHDNTDLQTVIFISIRNKDPVSAIRLALAQSNLCAGHKGLRGIVVRGGISTHGNRDGQFVAPPFNSGKAHHFPQPLADDLQRRLAAIFDDGKELLVRPATYNVTWTQCVS